MSFKNLQEILKKVEKPSRYIGTEINSIKKNHDECDLKFALAFPDLYDIGTSHFGIQILYHILNRQKTIVAERVFTPAPDMEDELRKNRIPLFSLESHNPLKNFDIIGFSLLYELNYTNILTILDLAGIKFLSSDRNETDPLIIAGGPSVFNPEPIADIFDVMVVGDGEKSILEISETWMRLKKENPDVTKTEILEAFSELNGIYIPSFYKPEYRPIGKYTHQILHPVNQKFKQVTKTIISDLEMAEFPDKPVIPYGKPVHDRLRLEISRGCSRGCRFCQAGMIYRPVRERKVETLIDIAGQSVCNTGYEDVSLLSLSTGDYENLNELMQRILEVNVNENRMLSFSLPSIRAGQLTSDLMETIKSIKKTGFTIAPEAGTQRLRDYINKGLNEEDIIKTVQDAFSLGWKTIKLYFMIGLPSETEEDLQGIVDLVKKLRALKYSKGKKPNINVSVSTFVPKAHTPFQWSAQITEEESWEKIQWLKENLKMGGVTLKWGKTNISYLEGIISRGDRRITPLIINAYNKGCRLDGWNEYLRTDLWKEAIEEENIDVEFYSNREKNIDEPLPWDVIDTGILKSFLKDELERAEKLIRTEDCRNGNCIQCGICDFESIQPEIQKKSDYKTRKNEPFTDVDKDSYYKKIKIGYSKQGKSRYFGHLELVNIFTTILRQLKIPLKYSGGFNPKIKIVFNNPLPLGYGSLDEYFSIQVELSCDLNQLKERLNALLPEGLDILYVNENPEKEDLKEKDTVQYKIILEEGEFTADKIDHFNNCQSVLIEKVNKKGLKKTYNLKDFIKSIRIINKSELIVDITRTGNITVRPEIAVKEIFNTDDGILNNADILKLKNY